MRSSFINTFTHSVTDTYSKQKAFCSVGEAQCSVHYLLESLTQSASVWRKNENCGTESFRHQKSFRAKWPHLIYRMLIKQIVTQQWLGGVAAHPSSVSFMISQISMLRVQSSACRPPSVALSEEKVPIEYLVSISTYFLLILDFTFIMVSTAVRRTTN